MHRLPPKYLPDHHPLFPTKAPRLALSLPPTPEPSAASPPPTNHERAPPPSSSANGRKPAGRADEAHGPRERGCGESGGPGENTTWRRAGRTEPQQRPREGSEVSAEGGKRGPSPRRRRRSPSLPQTLPHTHTPLLRSPGKSRSRPRAPAESGNAEAWARRRGGGSVRHGERSAREAGRAGGRRTTWGCQIKCASKEDSYQYRKRGNLTPKVQDDILQNKERHFPRMSACNRNCTSHPNVIKLGLVLINKMRVACPK
ncbi:serine/arginine repetitive matrix protein 3-like [Equus przewalskii]|uniref:Serine/arginine repetitive matrix protein 3-like n=1 Tax=Equus przewalskii TaxID=9798 RepID=A0ABM4M4C1_EQUPR